jgi:dihydroneopterin aldolase
VRAVVEDKEFNLLERLATVLCDGLWDEFDPALVEVAVSKIAPPVSLPIHAARVEVVRTS